MSIASPRSFVKEEKFCKLCNLGIESRSLYQVEELITIEKANFPRKSILEKVIPSLKILSKYQIKNLTRITTKFCEACINNYSSPNYFKNCQNKLCQKDKMIQAILATDLTLFSNLKSNQFKISQVQSSRFCQFCRNVGLSEAELRIFNQLLDRQLRGKSIALIESQRSRRATNLKNSLMPRALAVFPVISKNIGLDQNNNHL